MRLKPLRAKRRQRLLESHLLPFEAMTISTVALRQPYNRALRKDRRKMWRQWVKKARLAKWSQRRLNAEFEAQIKADYHANKWVIPRSATVRRRMIGQPDAWAMLREYRQKALDSGEYQSKKKKRKKSFDEHGRRIDKGNVIEQKRRHRERERERKVRGRESTGIHLRYTEEDLNRHADERGY